MKREAEYPNPVRVFLARLLMRILLLVVFPIILGAALIRWTTKELHYWWRAFRYGTIH